jgi:hypothetical protein
MKYVYNFREMSKTCERCLGEGLLNTKSSSERTDDKELEHTARLPGAVRVMTHKQRYSTVGCLRQRWVVVATWCLEPVYHHQTACSL